MTGKQLKEFSTGISDDAVIEIREKSYSSWYDEFSIRATTQKEWSWIVEQTKVTPS